MIHVFFFNDTAPTEIYTYCHTLSLHDALPISTGGRGVHLGLVADPTLWSLLARTLAVTAGVLALALGIGLPMAVLVARTDVIRRGPALILHAIPALLPLGRASCRERVCQYD